jgi:hypothetical protein
MADTYDDVYALVADVELDDIVAHEERGRRLYWTEEELEAKKLPETINSFGFLAVGNTLRFRFRSVFTDENAEYVADFEAVYGVPGEAEVSEAVTQEFASRVAFMAIYPYLRASVYGSAARLGQPIPVLGIVKQGQFSGDEKMTEEEVKAAFHDNKSERL